MRVRKIALFLFTAIVLISSSSFVSGADINPAADLAESLIYWQEQALKLSNENTLLTSDNERLYEENQGLKENLADAETVMRELQVIINDLTVQAEKINSLRIQAENALSLANLEIQKLEEAIKKLSSARFGLLFGATYQSGEIGGLAGVVINF